MHLFTEVPGGEGAQLLLLTIDVFLIVAAYYVMKPKIETINTRSSSRKCPAFRCRGAQSSIPCPSRESWAAAPARAPADGPGPSHAAGHRGA